MSTTISLVNGDSRANVQITLVREDTGGVFNATGARVRLFIRKKGTTAAPSEFSHIAGSSDLAKGIIIFSLGAFTALDSTVAGHYEGEIEVEFDYNTADSAKQTVFEAITILVRDDFSP
jgi:hypothetical protein